MTPDQRDWGRVRNGQAFEGLATTLIYFEDPAAALFGRSGRDGAQDARSGDGQLVYQMKHHVDATADKAIADAKAEAAMIAKYRAPAHARHGQWAAVTSWRLVTNAEFNPTDKQRWDTEVVPIFAKLGLAADYWERANLEALLAKHPEVDRAFFGGESRAFLTLPEVRKRPTPQPDFLVRGDSAVFRGRAQELLGVQEFLKSDKLFLIVHGAGGIGKTRLLLEAGEEAAKQGAWQVLWANVATMEAAGSWFDAVNKHRKTLLLVDEPETEAVLRQLLEQLVSPGGAEGWKVAVAVRSPKDPVLRFLSGPKVQGAVTEVGLGPLTQNDAEAVCEEMLATGPLASRPAEWRRRSTRLLAERFGRHPIWLALAVHVLEVNGDLAPVPDTADALAAFYVDEILSAQKEVPTDRLLGLLRWLALFGTLNREEDGVVQTLSEMTALGGPNKVKAAIARLVVRRALSERGARQRLVEVKPDVIRDHILRQWLTTDIGFGAQPIIPSDEAESLTHAVVQAVCAGNLSGQGRAVLTSLARTEALLTEAGHPVSLLSQFFAEVTARLADISASARVRLADLMTSIAEVQPMQTVGMSQALRSLPVATEMQATYLGSREISQDDVVLALAWPVFHAAMGARSKEHRVVVLRELNELVAMEEDIATRRDRPLPNDGKRAAQLVERTLEGGPTYWGTFEDAAETICIEGLMRAVTTPLAPGAAKALTAILEPATSVERRETWTEGHTFQIRNYVILPGHPAWDVRARLLERLKALLADGGVPVANRAALWPVFAHAHATANRGSEHVRGDGANPLRDELRSNLQWALEALRARVAPLAELTAARDLWDWHRRFDEGPRKAVADELEALYSTNSLAGEFVPLVGHEEWEQREPRGTAKAVALASADDPNAIRAFVERAVEFLRGADRIHEVLHVAAYLGPLAAHAQSVRTYLQEVLSTTTPDPAQLGFAVVVASRWTWEVRREAPDDTAPLVSTLLAGCALNSTRVALLRQIYGFVPSPRSAGTPTAAELCGLRASAKLFLDEGAGPAFVEAIAWAIDYDWSGLKLAIEDTLSNLPEGQVASAVRALTDAVYWGVRDAGDAGRPIPADIGEWLLAQMLRVPDLDDQGDMVHWHLAEILKKVPRPGVKWLIDAMRSLAADEGKPTLPRRRRLSQYVRPMAPDEAKEEDVVRAVAALIDMCAERGHVGYYLPQYAHDVDPSGLLVPAEVARRIAALADAETDAAWRLARIAGVYSLNSLAWRTIAAEVVPRAMRIADKERRSLFNALTDPRPAAWSSGIGEVPERFVEQVRRARELVEVEPDPVFRPFWEWMLAIAEAELHDQEERAKEDRGE